MMASAATTPNATVSNKYSWNCMFILFGFDGQ
jgi:hypothetical protein